MGSRLLVEDSLTMSMIFCLLFALKSVTLMLLTLFDIRSTSHFSSTWLDMTPTLTLTVGRCTADCCAASLQVVSNIKSVRFILTVDLIWADFLEMIQCWWRVQRLSVYI